MAGSSRYARVRALAVTALLTLATVSACSDDDGGSAASSGAATPRSTTTHLPSLPAALTDQKPDWRRCGEADALQGGDGSGPPKPLDGTSWQCATVKAPLDYAHPDGAAVDLAVIRATAKDRKNRIGSLIFNFGGPGGSGVATLPPLAAEQYGTLHTRYDLVSFDPRGVGASSPVRCLGDKALDTVTASDSTPDDSAEVTSYLRTVRQQAAACRKNSGKELPYVDTVSAARDMDLLRQVLGDDRLHYFGISYGTELGGVYAHLYPRTVGRAVLDAVVDPAQDPVRGSLAQAKGFQLALDNFLEDCEKEGDACPVRGGPEKGSATIAALLDRLDRRPLPTDDGRKVTQALALNGITQALYSQQLWPALRQGLQEALQLRTGNVLLLLSDALTGRNDQGRYSNIQAANAAVVCADSKQRYTVDDVKARLPQFRRASAVFGPTLAWALLQCTDWPVAGLATSTDVSARGSAPILVIGNTGDPATPYAGARKMADDLGKGVGVRVVFHGQGHGAYGNGACVDGIVNRYLLDGKVPAGGTVCR